MSENEEWARHKEFHARLEELLEGVMIDTNLPDFTLQLSSVIIQPPSIQICHYRKDVVTGVEGWGYSPRATLNDRMTDGDILRRGFGLLMGYLEHEAREAFLWHRRRIFGPHIPAEELWGAADPERQEDRA